MTLWVLSLSLRQGLADLEERIQSDGICKQCNTGNKETVQHMLLKCNIVDEHCKTGLVLGICTS